jgi:glutathione S-transferase
MNSTIEGQSTSPFVWRIKFALQGKGIAYESAPTGFFNQIANINGRLAAVPMITRA